MKFYDFEDICREGSCIDYVRSVVGVEVVEGRCRAAWRGGDNPQSVSVTKEKWYDFGAETGGGLIQLCALHKFGGVDPVTTQKAQEFLGEWLHLVPKVAGLVEHRPKPLRLRMKKLEAEGYHEVKRYDYVDEAGKVVHTTVRYEKPGSPKQFVQCTPDADNLDGVRTVIYNLPAVLKAAEVILTEGEKDAETLIEWGFVGTTVPMGARKWQEWYAEWFRGRRVVILRDRDEAGLGHAKLVASKLADVAASLKVVCVGSAAKDVTEWRDGERGTAEKLREIIDASPVLEPGQCLLTDEELALIAAKDANQTPFSNFRMTEAIVNGKAKQVREPIPMRELVAEVFKRFLGFPRRLGEYTLFDHDRDTGEIRMLKNADALLAWIQYKSGQLVVWKGIDGAATQRQLFEAMVQRARRYEGISEMPYWPSRTDTYLISRDKFLASPAHEAFEKFMTFFNPADEASRLMLRAFVAAPLYFRYGVQRPCWTIDSVDGPGVGKTTLVEVVAMLYKCTPLKITRQQLMKDFDEINKKLLSSGGRSTRIALVDNVVGEFRSPEFADLVTCFSVSGRPSYGPGEETRPNDMTYCITANNAQISNDIASRTYTINLKRPSDQSGFKENLFKFIEENRPGIIGDILAILDAGPGFDAAPATRCPEFERQVLMPMCGTEEGYRIAIAGMLGQRDASNVEQDRARQAQEIVEFNLTKIFDQDARYYVVFIRSEVISVWLRDLHVDRSELVGYSRNGMLTCFEAERGFQQYPSGDRYGVRRAMGLFYVGPYVSLDTFLGVHIIGRTDKESFGVVNGTSLHYFREARVVEMVRQHIGDATDAEVADEEEEWAP